MSFELTPEGLTIESIDEIRGDLEQDLRDTFHKSLPLGDKTILGHVVGIISERLALVEERVEQVVQSQTPAASDDALDAVCALTGTFRPVPLPSEAAVILCGDDGTVVTEGNVVATASTAKPFDTQEDVTLALLSDWAAATVYAVDDRVTNSARCYQCITAGTSAGAGGPTTTDPDITDNTCHWAYIGEGTAAGDTTAKSEEDGPIVAAANDLTVIQTPVAGWKSVRNLSDALLGRVETTNEALRILRELELEGNGGTTSDALRSKLLKLQNVLSVHVFNNYLDTTNGDGMPPHTFEALVLGGEDQEIVDTIAENQPEGIASYGTSSGIHVDSEGVDQTIKFTRPTLVTIYVDVTLIYDATTYAGDAAVKQAIEDAGKFYVTDLDVFASKVTGAVFTVSGVLDVPRSGSLGGTLIDVAPGPTSDATIPIGSRELAVFAATRVTVHSTPGTP